MNRSALVRFALAAGLLAVLPMQPSSAYSLKTYKWATTDVPFYVNPANLDVATSSAISAVNTGAVGWTFQSHTPFQFRYAGTTTGTTVGNNGKNEVMFRNASNGSAVATTYTYYSSGKMLDADIVFWDGAYKLFTGTSGCSSGLYIEDVATHEFGHALGLNHSSVSGATMTASISYCSQAMRSLALDDIQGVEALYPPVGTTNALPTISISSPTNGASYTYGTAVTLAGSAQDAEDGVLTSKITWSSSISGTLGSGGSLSVKLVAGSHRVTARVTDSNGAVKSTYVDITIKSTTTTTPTSGPKLSASGTKIKGWKYADQPLLVHRDA